MISYFQAIILGLLQGVTELFPISSLGHTVVLPWLFGWHNILANETKGESFYLAFVVMLHVGTALALLLFYRNTWLRIIKGFFSSVARQKIDTPDARLAWLLILATIPAGLIGVIFEHKLRVIFAKPLDAICFLAINGVILLVGDRLLHHKPAGGEAMDNTVSHVGKALTPGKAIAIGVAQVGALFAGISRSGVTMVSGLASGLNHEDAARFSFLLATPIILAAGLYKMPDFFGPLGDGVRAQTLVAGVVAAVAAYFSVKFLDRYFRDKTLRPFAIYCLVAAAVLLLVGLARGGFAA
ncbi:MAG TPA: undecaprenyl-diphosphate phosphatase [Candidatus Saccharimonadales bacterium]|nr:undecaprenyl-diphosphate phosphatase [Candidatus Saccharimonadales bacterium]